MPKVDSFSFDELIGLYVYGRGGVAPNEYGLIRGITFFHPVSGLML